MEERYILKKSVYKPGYWVCTDTKYMLNCTFENKNLKKGHDFQFINGFDPVAMNGILGIVMVQMLDWIEENHKDKV